MKEKVSPIIEDFRWGSVPEPGINVWIWVAAACLVLLIVAGLFLIRRRRRKGHGLFSRPPTPHEIALKAFSELGDLLKEDCGLEFTIKVSNILRVYLQGRFGLRAPHRSSEEFLEEASGSGALNEEHQRLLAGFLTRCDLVKFAKRSVVVDEMKNLLAAARGFVEATIPQEPSLTPAK